MCGKKQKAPPPPPPDPLWTKLDAKNTANRGAEPAVVDQNRRVGATNNGSTLGGANADAGATPTTSLLGG